MSTLALFVCLFGTKLDKKLISANKIDKKLILRAKKIKQNVQLKQINMDKLSKTERLIAICNRFFGGCKRKMALCLGITEQSLSKWFLRGRIDYDLVIEKIPSLNPVWLLLGVGPMILTQENSANENINENNDSDMVRITLSEYVELKETIKIQDEKIKAIQSIVA